MKIYIPWDFAPKGARSLTPGFFYGLVSLKELFSVHWRPDFNWKRGKGVVSNSQPSKRVAVFVDGFNVYHFMNKNSNLRKYKWLNYCKLAECYIPRDSHITSVHYFTAFATWDKNKVSRHQIYIKALESVGVTAVVGRFKMVKRPFVIKNDFSRDTFATSDGQIRGTLFEGYTFEEKKTDVAIASYILRMAAQKSYDVALLISGDTDFEPALQELRSMAPHVQIVVAVPNKHIAGSIKSLVGSSNCVSIREKDLAASQLPAVITLPSGSTISAPNTWA